MCEAKHLPGPHTSSHPPSQVAIIGRDQVTTDIPEHSYMKLSKGGCGEDMTYHTYPHLSTPLSKGGCAEEITYPHLSTPHPPGGRDIDATTRGLGGTDSLAVTSCGEENLTMVGGRSAPEGGRLYLDLDRSRSRSTPGRI